MSFSVIDVLSEAKLVTSRSEARRLLNQRAIEIDGQRVDNDTVDINNGSIVRVGRHYFQLWFKDGNARTIGNISPSLPKKESYGKE